MFDCFIMFRLLIHAPRLKKLTHAVLLQVFKGLAIQRHLHLPLFPPLLHEKMLYNDVSCVCESIVSTNDLVLSQY
jgi:hypothetical protein